MKKQLTLLELCLFFMLLLINGPTNLAQAESYSLPENPKDSVVGDNEYINSNYTDTLVDIGRENDLGYDEVVKANPNVNRWLPGNGTRVLLPKRYILPDTPREGIVLNIPELRLYYYPPVKGSIPKMVETFPVSIGRMDWKTPLGKTKILKKEKDPPWYPTSAVRAEHEAEGDILPKFIPGGSSENPLGRFALRLGLPDYLIHGTDERKSYGIGMRVTHGCIRMYPEDIEHLFSLVSVNTPVYIVDQPVKVGTLDEQVFLEVNLPFEEGDDGRENVTLEQVSDLIDGKTKGAAQINKNIVAKLSKTGNGIATLVGQIEAP